MSDKEGVDSSLPAAVTDDPFLGVIDTFPTVLPVGPRFCFDINPESLQKALVSALASLRTNPQPRDITVADRNGYLKGQLTFRLESATEMASTFSILRKWSGSCTESRTGSVEYSRSALSTSLFC